MHRSLVEPLEGRTLLAGVTILAPTWDSTLGTYVLGAANNLVNRMGGFANAPWYQLNIAPNKDGTLAVQGITHDSRSGRNSNSPVDQIIFIVEYESVSQNPAYPLTQVASLVANYMENNTVDGMDLASVPIHLMGVSRSSVLMDDIAQSLGQHGIWVDYETYMDPHPVYAISDPQNVVYDNVAFADDYWRTSGTPEVGVLYNGTAVNGAYNQELPYVQAQNAGYGTPHVAPAGYYNATIDLNSTQEFGPGYGSPVYASWWGTTPDHPPRNQTGFYYSDYVGGPRPLSGVWANGGGTGARVSSGQTGVQWPNVTALKLSASTFASGDPIGVRFLHQDRGSNSTVTFSLDNDQNPINNNDAATLGSAAFAASSLSASDQVSLASAGVNPGNYYLRASITDGQGHTRYAFSQIITINPPAPVEVINPAAAKVAVIAGKSTVVSVLGGGTVDESKLLYTWSLVREPGGAPAPKFSANGTNASKKVTVTFGKDGSYHLRCTITAVAGTNFKPVISDVSVRLQQVASTLRISPHGAKVKAHQKKRFSTTVLDQFNHPMRSLPALRYVIAAGHGSISPSTGLFTASSKAGRVDVRVELDQLAAKVGLTVV